MAALLAGCSQPTVHMIGRGQAPSGSTTVDASGGSGEIVMPLGGRSYVGRWVYVSQGGGVGITTATASSGGRSATGTGTTIMAPTGGGGSIVMAAAGAPSIRCGFQYSSWSQAGAGECQDDAGASWDLQITR